MRRLLAALLLLAVAAVAFVIVRNTDGGSTGVPKSCSALLATVSTAVSLTPPGVAIKEIGSNGGACFKQAGQHLPGSP